MQDSYVLLHLFLSNGVGPSTIQIMSQLKPADMPWHELYRLTSQELRHLFQVGPVVAQNISTGLADDKLLMHELALIEKHGFSLISIIDPEYPQLLSHIHAPPPILYVQGASLVIFNKCLAIIGSRDADRYGKQVIESLVPPLIEHGWSIVSGGALGADAMAHAAALKAGGKTIAVLGSGLLHPRPMSNLALFDQILAADGALLSIFPLDTQGRAENFPVRNRVIAGLSRGVIVAQAARKSGTRITAQYALEQGRDVFAVPGLIDHPLSEGCHALIQEGAKLISRVGDVLEEYGEILNSDSSNAQFEHKELQQDLFNSLEVPEKNIAQQMGRTRPAKLAKPEGLDKCSGEGQSITQLISFLCKNPISLDDLMQETNIPYAELQTILFNMQLDGLIKQNFAGLWEVA